MGVTRGAGRGVRTLIASVVVLFAAVTAQGAQAQVLTVDSPSVVEGTGPTLSQMVFTVTLSPAAGTQVTVNYATQNTTTATAPADYTTATGQLTFEPGETTKTVSVPVVADKIYEFDETFRLNLSNPVGASLGPAAQGTGTITNDDDPPRVVVTDGVIPNPGVEGTHGNRIMEFSIRLVDAAGAEATSERPVSVSYETQVTGTGPGHAVPTSGQDGDFQTKTETLSFTRTQSARTVQIIIVGDTFDEVNETFKIALLNTDARPTINAVFEAPEEGIGTITDDDGPAIAIGDASSSEGAGGATTTAHFQISLAAASPQDVTVTYSTADDTAKAGEDYDAPAADAAVTIPAGSLLATVPLSLRGDDLDEPDEKFRVNLNSAVNGSLTATGADKQAVGTIVDDDAAPSVRAGNVQTAEGTGGEAAARITVTLSKPSGRLLVVPYRTVDGTATAGRDYQAPEGGAGLAFNPGEVSKDITIPLATDNEVEEHETFTVELTDIETGAAVPVTVTINDDDVTAQNMPRLLTGDTTVPREGDAGTTQAVFSVRLDKPLARTVTVRYTTADGSAKAGADYAATEGVLTFAPGETRAYVSVPVFGDTDIEFNQDFKLLLLHPVNATIGDGAGLGIIIDDDAGGGLVSIPAKSMKATSLLCRRSRRCRGMLVRWEVRRAGTMAVDVSALVRTPAKGRKSKGRASKVKVLRVARRVVKVKPGKGSARVKGRSGVRATRLLRKLRAAKVRSVRVVVTYTSRSGAQQVTRFKVALKYPKTRARARR